MEDETLQDALDYCLFNPDGLEMEELLAKFPESREELVPMLALCGLISEAVPPVPQERRDAMRGRIQDAALARQQAMATTSNGHHEGAVAATLPVLTVEPSPQPAARPVKLPGRVRVEEDRPRRSFLADWFRRPAFAAAAFAALLLAFVWGMSASALPNNPFYNVKLLGESIALNMQTSPEGKVLKHDELANLRLREIEEMDRRGDLDEAGGAFDNYAEHLREGQEILSGTQFTEQQQSRLARALYATSTTGEIKLAGLDDDIAGMPEKVQESLSESKQLQRQVRNYSAHVLEDLGEDPLSTLSPEAQDALKQTPGPEATALANFGSETAEPGPSATRASSSPTSLGSGSGDDETATRTATSQSPADRTATHVASNPLANPSATSTRTHSSKVTSTRTSVAASPTRTSTSVAVATSTSTARSEASPLASTPTPTTRPGNRATVTPPRGKPTETRRPESTRTPGRPPTHTPGPEKTKEKGTDPTATAVSTSTYTPVPPSNTPVPTSTFVPTETPTERPDSRPATHTPKPKELPTDTVEPTREPTEEPSEPPKPVTVCDVDVKDVSVGCGSGGCIEWSAQLVNKATEAMEVNWVAEMQVEVAGASPTTYRESGTVLVRPGEEAISGRFCETMPERTKKVRVVVKTETGGANCDSSKQRTVDPCESDEQDESKPTEEPKPTKQPEPTKEPRPTEEPEPTKEPKSTEEPKPTREPQSTIVPLPTIELFPTKTPKPR
ncbi:MAG TPA: DUF5667 domain-containing protein [Chloroflexia bacterium]|jgi:hypothetical protein